MFRKLDIDISHDLLYLQPPFYMHDNQFDSILFDKNAHVLYFVLHLINFYSTKLSLISVKNQMRLQISLYHYSPFLQGVLSINKELTFSFLG
jgi:hypothetical protein